MECSICFEPEIKCTKLTCRHIFCKKHESLIKSNKVCPICRLKVMKLGHKIEDIENKLLIIEQDKKLYYKLKCSICIGLINNPVTLSCNHNFCYNCLDLWLKNNHNCPNCRCNIRGLKIELLKKNKEIEKELNAFKLKYSEDVNSVTFEELIETELKDLEKEIELKENKKKKKNMLEEKKNRKIDELKVCNFNEKSGNRFAVDVEENKIDHFLINRNNRVELNNELRVNLLRREDGIVNIEMEKYDFFDYLLLFVIAAFVLVFVNII